MVGIKTLTIGYTRDIELAEKIARATGAKELLVETRPEGDTLMLNSEEQVEWRRRGWTLDGRTAKKGLVANTLDDRTCDEDDREKKGEIQSIHGSEGYSEGGRLKASMLIKDRGQSQSHEGGQGQGGSKIER